MPRRRPESVVSLNHLSALEGARRPPLGMAGNLPGDLDFGSENAEMRKKPGGNGWLC